MPAARRSDGDFFDFIKATREDRPSEIVKFIFAAETEHVVHIEHVNGFQVSGGSSIVRPMSERGAGAYIFRQVINRLSVFTLFFSTMRG